MKSFKSALIAACAIFTHEVYAGIISDGIWSDYTWYDDVMKIGVDETGTPYSNDEKIDRMITSPLSLDGPVDNYQNFANVQRVQRIFPEEKFNEGFKLRNEVYTYENFLKAVARFPAFCNETNLNGWSIDDTCKRELAAMFAHWGQETGKRDPQQGEFWKQALYYVEEINKGEYKSWNWSDSAWPNQVGVKYFGRGPLQLSWNYNYGQFSNIYGTSKYDSKM